MGETSKTWAVYILRCSDETLYTGITTDIKRRINEHNFSSLGAKYTRARRPVRVVYEAGFCNRSMAAQKECYIKRLPKLEKEKLITAYLKNVLDHKLEL